MTVVLGMGTAVKPDLRLRGEDNLGHNLVYDTDLDITWYDHSHLFPEYKDAVNWTENYLPKLAPLNSRTGDSHHSWKEKILTQNYSAILKSGIFIW